MKFGKYGEMILANIKNNFPYRYEQLKNEGILEEVILKREHEILRLRGIVEEKVKVENAIPKTNEAYVIAKYQKLIEALVDEKIMDQVLEKI